MTTSGGRTTDRDPGSPGHRRYPGINQPDQAPIDEALWSRVRSGQQVAPSLGETLGRVHELSPHLVIVETKQNLWTTRELYVPHMAVSSVEDDIVRLEAPRDRMELEAA